MCVLSSEQAHSFIAMAVIIGTYFVLDIHQWMADPWQLSAWAPAGAVAIAIAYPQYLVYQNMVNEGIGGNFISYGPIFRNHNRGSSLGLLGDGLLFWWRSLGPLLYLYLVAAALALPALIRLGVTTVRAGMHFIQQRKKDDDLDTSLRKFRLRAAGQEDAVIAAAAPRDVLEEDAPEADAIRPEDAAETGSGPVANGAVPTHHSRRSAPVRADNSFTRFFQWIDEVVSAGNKRSVFANTQLLNAFKIHVGAVLLFLIGNFVNFQPWDRDNIKIFYISLFILTGGVGRLLVVPFDHLLNLSNRHGVDPDAEEDDRHEGRRSHASRRVGTTPSGTLERKVEQHVAWNVVWLLLSFVSVGLVVFCSTSGVLSVIREYRMNNELYGPPEKELAEYMIANVPPKSVVLTKDDHRQAAGMLAGRPSLAGYSGWLWSHGYNFHERNVDRNHILHNLLKDDDETTYQLLRKWGVRYVVGENLPQYPRDTNQPKFHKDFYLNRRLKRIYSNHKYDLFIVLGYNHPPT